MLPSLGPWWSRNENRFGTWASILGLLLGALLGLRPELFATTVKEYVYSFALVMLCVSGFVASLIFHAQLGRKARCAEVLVNLRGVVRRLVDPNLAASNSAELRRIVLSQVMDDISTAFSVLTGSSCRCCIKTVEFVGAMAESETTMGVKTQCRNAGFIPPEEAHPIKFNTAFHTLYQDRQKLWFFGNNLPEMARRGEYNNTTPNWQARYLSAVVWPIRRIFEDPETRPIFLGYLCVDSRQLKPFSEQFDYPIGAAVADVLYPFLFSFVQAPTEMPAVQPGPERLSRS